MEEEKKYSSQKEHSCREGFFFKGEELTACLYCDKNGAIEGKVFTVPMRGECRS